ncbi:auxin-responsive protein SAUR21 [Gossypium australe]|uniref:Auxin-responsive protein SAUR21 n=1 Tax=Gossypium australe TaxID=47621 RepID=A0A5B6X0L1_9ROSI|nr:auxin-responsive protein SAUR21 [Gossypium australe]
MEDYPNTILYKTEYTKVPTMSKCYYLLGLKATRFLTTHVSKALFLRFSPFNLPPPCANLLRQAEEEYGFNDALGAPTIPYGEEAFIELTCNLQSS